MRGARGAARGGRMLVAGIAGTVLTAICCFTPVLVVALAALGVTSVAWLDAVLLPLLFFFIALTLYALFRRGRPQRFRGGSDEHRSGP